MHNQKCSYLVKLNFTLCIFRDVEKLNELTADDRIEIFRTILVGSSDFTKELLEDVLSDYSVLDLKVINTNDEEQLA